MRKNRRHRSDVVLFDTLDGQPLVWSAAVMYSADNPNPAVAPFAERLAARLRGVADGRHVPAFTRRRPPP